MKTTPHLSRAGLLALAGLCLAASASAAPVLWSGAGGDDLWSTPGNWIGGAPESNEVFFADADATGTSGPYGLANNNVDSNVTIGRLSYTNLTTAGYHTTQINPGVTLTVTNSGQTVLVNAPFLNIAAAQVYATVLGAGTLNLTNPSGVMVIGQGATSANSSRRATLDLSGLDTLKATLGRIILGQQTTVSNRANATLLLARTNVIDLAQTGTTAGLQVGELQSNNGNSQIVGLGVTNVVLSDSGLTIGGRKGDGVLQFNSGIVGSGEGMAWFRARNGVSRQARWLVGDNSAQSGGGTYAGGTVDFSALGAVDALVDTMILGRSTAGLSTGGTTSQGTLKFDAGTVDVNTLLVGVQNNVDGGPVRGTVQVDGTGHLIVNGNLILGRYLGGSYMSHGVVNIGLVSGGTVTVHGDVICSGGVGNIITLFGALELGGKLGDLVNATNTPLETLDLWSGTLVFDRGAEGNPVNPLASVTNLNVNGNITVNVRGLNLTPGQFPLIKYYSGLGDVGGYAGFAGLTLALPNKVEGYLSNHTANASVDVVITNVSGTKWSGAVNSDWDISQTANWVTTPSGNPTTYYEATVPGDAVLFDDTAALTIVNLTTTLSPGGIVVSNVTKPYTFNGAGALSGSTDLLKRGAGALTLANSGANAFTGGIAIEAGKVQLAGSADRLPPGSTVTLSDAPTAQLDLNNLNQSLAVLNGGGSTGGNVSLGSGTLTLTAGGGSYAGVIDGSGSVVKDGSGAQVLGGANVHSGGTRVVAGTLTLANASGSGSGSGAVSVETTNATLRLGDGGANGSAASGTIPNEGLVVLNRSDDLSFATVLTGNGNFRKENTNVVTLAVANAHAGITTIAAGALRVGHADALGDIAGETSILNDATARLELAGGVTLAEPLRLAQKQTAAGYAPGLVNLSGVNTLTGLMELAAGGSYWIIHSSAGKLVVNGPTTNATTSNVRTLWLSGEGDGEWNTGFANGTATATGALRKDGPGTWKIGGALTYTGGTVISNGTLVVNGVITSSSGVTVAEGVLGGNGAISAPITVDSEGTLAPGDGGIGHLSVFNTLTLAGTNLMELAKVGATVTNDQVSVLLTLTLGGTLQVTLNGAVSGGEVFSLFTAGTFAGAFDVLDLPNLPGSLTWDTSNLAVNGTLAVVGGGVQPMLNVAQNGSQLTFSWTETGYKLQAQTNAINVGLSNNWSDYPDGGTSGVSVPLDPANPAVFFRLISQ